MVQNARYILNSGQDKGYGRVKIVDVYLLFDPYFR